MCDNCCGVEFRRVCVCVRERERERERPHISSTEMDDDGSPGQVALSKSPPGFSVHTGAAVLRDLMAEDKRKGERREQTDCATGGPVGWVEAAWTDVVTFVTM